MPRVSYKVFDTTGLQGQGASFVMNDPTSSAITNPFILNTNHAKTPIGIGSISRRKYRFPAKAVLVTDNTVMQGGTRDEFDLARAYDLT